MFVKIKYALVPLITINPISNVLQEKRKISLIIPLEAQWRPEFDQIKAVKNQVSSEIGTYQTKV